MITHSGFQGIHDALGTFVGAAGELISPRALIALTTAAVGAAYACGDKAAVTGPEQPTEQASIVFTGPDSVRLSCDLEGSAHYVISVKKGPIVNLYWRLDGTTIGYGSEIDVSFSSLGTHSVQLDGYANDGKNVASANKTVVAQLPADLSSCAPASRITGRFAVLIPTNAESSSSLYAAHVPPALEDHVDNFHWTLQRESDAPQELAAGQDASSVTVAFSQEGAYTLRLEEAVGSTTTPIDLHIQVRRGDPLLEAGQIAVVRRMGSSLKTIYLLDAETGILSDPLVQAPDIGSRVSCTGELLVFTKEEPNSIGEMKSSLYEIGLDGSGVQRIIHHEGNVSEPSIRGHVIAVVDDSRVVLSSPELATYDLDTKKFTYLSGQDPDEAYEGSNTAIRISSLNTVIGLGDVRQTIQGTMNFYIVEYTSSGTILGPIHDKPLFDVYGDSLVVEGGGGVAYDPQNEYLAYDVNLVTSARNMIALSNQNGGDVTLLTEGRGPVFFSPSGDHILYEHLNYDEQSTELMMMGRDGSNAVNITRSVLGAEGMVSDIAGGYCYDPSY